MRLLELEPTDPGDRQAEKNAEAGGAGTNRASDNAIAGEASGAGPAPPPPVAVAPLAAMPRRRHLRILDPGKNSWTRLDCSELQKKGQIAN